MNRKMERFEKKNVTKKAVEIFKTAFLWINEYFVENNFGILTIERRQELQARNKVN